MTNTTDVISPVVKKQSKRAQVLPRRYDETVRGKREAVDFLSPVCNTGGKLGSSQAKPSLELDRYVILHNGKESFPVLISRPTENEIAAIDWISVSGGYETYGDKYLGLDVAQREKAFDYMADLIDADLKHIFGFGILKKRDKGMHFHEYSWELEDNFGLLLIGHATGRFTIQINGTGTAYASKGWEKRLYNYMVNELERAKITRIDLCHDDLEGIYDLDFFNEQDTLGMFGNGGRLPTVQHFGNWKRPDGKGRTLQLGKRENGKCGRFYEKGKQLGDPSSPWVRSEIEISSTDRIIPFEVLLSPSQYFLAQYQCLNVFNQDSIQPVKIYTKQIEAEITWEKAVHNARHSYGKYINMFRQVYSDEELLDILTHKRTQTPARLIPCEILAKRWTEEAMQSTSDYLTASGARSQVAIKESLTCN
ncbi:replication initiation factor domain-containing protein [Aquirhabdus parva]|nr:replication initiation factor domain-containing protein [Aquirhabdus parva]